MSIAVMSLLALVVALVVSCVTPKNIGVLAIALAFVVGGLFGGVSTAKIVGGFPLALFMTLVGVTYLFGIAQANDTIDKITKYAVRAVGGRIALLPIILFFVAFALASIGPGQIAIVALMAPPCMLLAEKVGISPFLMALMVGNGGQAGAVSPIAPTGIIANGLAAKLGFTGIEFSLFFYNFLGHMAVGVIAYVLFGGLALWKQRKEDTSPEVTEALSIKVDPFNRQQIMTLIGIGALLVIALVFKKDVGLSAFTIGAILTLLNAADENKAIKAMPWSTILMVCGVTVLIGLMKDVGGMALFASFIANFSTPFTVTFIYGFVAAIISVYASTSGVILPAFIPMIPDLIKSIGGGDAMALINTVVVAGHLVDVSPLSTTGALLIAGAGPLTDKTKLFRQMIYWGFAMSIIGAAISWLFFTVLKFS